MSRYFTPNLTPKFSNIYCRIPPFCASLCAGASVFCFQTRCTIAECCKELKEGTTVDTYLHQTPNGASRIGNEQDRYILNSRLVRGEHMTRWKFLGILFGVAIRTKKPLNLMLSNIVWKQLCGYKLTFEDIASVNELFAKNMEFLRNCSQEEEFDMCVPFERWEVQCWNGEYIHLNLAGRECLQGPPLTFDCRKSYIQSGFLKKIRCRECHSKLISVFFGRKKLYFC